MANKNLISTTDLIAKATEIIRNHQLVLDEAAKSYKNLVTSAKLPSTYVSNLKSQKDSLDALNKSTKELEKTEKQLQRERIAELKLQSKREKAFDRYDKQLEREQRRLQRTTGLYNQVQQRVNKLTREYNDLAAKKALNGKLTQQELSSLEFLEKQLNKYQGVLKKVDSNIGKYQRNVGNYASGYDGLGNSIAQIGREMPAFANSVQTGFMAISNNLPIFFDEIQRTKNEIAALRAEGKQTRGLMSRLASSFFSFQTLLNVGVVLLTVYGKELVDLAFGASAAEKAQKELNTELAKSEAEARKASKEIETLSAIVLDTTRNEVQRTEALKTLNELIPETTKFNIELLDANNGVNKANKEFISITGLYVKAAIARAKADIFAQKAAQKEISLSEEKSKSLDDQLKWYEKLLNVFGSGAGYFKAIERTAKENKAATDSIDFLNEAAEEQLALALELESGLKGVGNSTKKYKEEVKKTHEEVEKLKEIFKDFTEEFSNAIEGKITVDATGIDDLEAYNEAFIRSEELLRRLQNQTEVFLSGFSSDFINSSPLSSLSVFFDGTFELLQAGADTTAEKFAVSFNAITESAQQAFNFISELGQQNFQERYAQLEEQKNLALQFGSETEEGRREIEEQYETRRRQIQREQAEAQKKQAAFNVLINTGQAAVAAFSSQLIPGDPTSLPRAIKAAAFTTALGLAQLLAIQSQEIPAFWMGGETDKSGNILVNDDPLGVKGRNYKEVIERPDGRIIKPQGKNVKMNVPKGTKIHPTYSSFLESMNERLLSNGIAPFSDSAINTPLTPITVVESNGISEQTYQNGVNRLEKAINSKSALQVVFDESGNHKYILKGQAKRELLNKVFKIESRRV